MQFEYDPERLIEEVKKRPGIWDYEDPSYRTMVTRHVLWNEVVDELLDSCDKITKSEKRELVIQLQKKWKSVKDAFQKYVQNPNRSRRPYLYYKHLQFLMKNLQGATEDDGAVGVAATGSMSESEEVTKKKKRASWRKRKIRLVKDEERSSEDDRDYAEVPALTYDEDTDNVPLKMQKVSKVTGDFAFANVDPKSYENDDSDKMFLMSLLPHLKTIPEEDRLNVKLELMQVLQKANYNNGNRVMIG